MRCIKRVVGALAILMFAGLVVMYSGVINVAATEPHSALTAFVLGTTRDRSVSFHAQGIAVPVLDDEQMVMDGFHHYREMCAGCHLAPGIESSDIRAGLRPRPPRLRETVEAWAPEELFWIVSNGVKMTGMPAWGESHSDSEIWSIVAFLERLPEMSAARYEELDEMAASTPSQSESHTAP